MTAAQEEPAATARAVRHQVGDRLRIRATRERVTVAEVHASPLEVSYTVRRADQTAARVPQALVLADPL